MNYKYILLLMLLLVPIASAIDITTPINFAGSSTNITLNYSTSISNLEFDSTNNSLTLGNVTHSFTSTGNMNVSLDSFFELYHTGDSGTWTVTGMEAGNYSVYINDVFSTTISNGEPVLLTTTATYSIEPENEFIYFNMTMWEPLNETCAKFTIYNIYRPWYPELSYTVADHTYFLYYDDTGSLMATNTTINTNDTIILKSTSLLSAGNYTITHIDSDLIGATTPDILTFSPTNSPTFSILPSGSIQRSFEVNIAEADSNLETRWYYGQKFFSSYANNEDYISAYNYTLAETDTMDTTQSIHTFTTSEIETVGIIARLINTSTNLYEDRVWNWVIQSPDFTQDMEYSRIPTGSTNTVTLTTSNEEISDVILQYEINGEYYNVSMASVYANYEYGEVVNGETSYTYTETFSCEVPTVSEGTYSISTFYITQDFVIYALTGDLTFTAADGASSVSYHTASGGGSSGGSSTKKTTDVIETLSIKDGNERFKEIEKHALYSVSSEDSTFTVTVKTDYTNIDENIYKQFDISVTNIQDVPYEFTFLVDSSWVAEHGDAKLMHYVNNEWVEVPTTVVSTTEDFVKYSAKLISFSPYAIVADDKPTLVNVVQEGDNIYYIVAVIIFLTGIIIYIELTARLKT